MGAEPGQEGENEGEGEGDDDENPDKFKKADDENTEDNELERYVDK